MKNATTIVAGLLVIGLAFLPAATSEEVEGTYLLSATPGLSLTACVYEVPEAGLEDLDICVGGFIFPPTSFPEGKSPVTATFADASGGAVDFTVCQDFNDSGFCGEEGEPSVSGCGTAADLTDSETPFDPEFSIATFVRLWEPDCPDTVATSGTITLTFS